MRSRLRHLNWLLNPIHGLSTDQVYEVLGTASLTRSGLYLNLGYWRDADDMDEASDALARLVADAGAMSRDDRVLDCGFGFADQDMLWARERSPASIVGLNITASQVNRARQRVSDAGLDGIIDLRQGSATAMPIEDGSIDLVISLESAFHYDTRERFFAEAFRVLKPGGRLVTADIVPMPLSADHATRWRQRFSWYLIASRFNIPKANAYGIASYRERLTAAGFDHIAIESIRAHVYAPLHAYFAAHQEQLENQDRVARAIARHALTRDPEHVYAGLDYILAIALKAT